MANAICAWVTMVHTQAVDANFGTDVKWDTEKEVIANCVPWEILCNVRTTPFFYNIDPVSIRFGGRGSQTKDYLHNSDLPILLLCFLSFLFVPFLLFAVLCLQVFILELE
jgi:hypothetical protein